MASQGLVLDTHFLKDISALGAEGELIDRRQREIWEVGKVDLRGSGNKGER